MEWDAAHTRISKFHVSDFKTFARAQIKLNWKIWMYFLNHPSTVLSYWTTNCTMRHVFHQFLYVLLRGKIGERLWVKIHPFSFRQLFGQMARSYIAVLFVFKEILLKYLKMSCNVFQSFLLLLKQLLLKIKPLPIVFTEVLTSYLINVIANVI